ncbi:MAG: hypothetical protein PUH48_01900, partial [Prevotella sp.]|nr:hypothetical protein [Prevotella sp.]
LNIEPSFDAAKGIVVKELLQGYDYSSCSQFCILDIKKTNIMSKLMPSIYRQTEGAERFYNAENETYLDENGNYYSFNNPYVPSEPLEGKQDFEDIQPTINGITNENGELFGEIAAVAFDDTDSDDLSIEDAKDANTNTAKPVHPYFYVKLHRFSGENGFNLFKQGLAQGAMTFNFITGSCAGCSFKVQVSEGKQVDNHYEFQNLVQVDEQGNIVAGDSGDKIKASNPIDSQQDTMTNSVWVALEKDNSTFGVLMPNATNNYRPQAGDKFVITNILLPTQYITVAEKRLEAALIKYMSENNDEKFTFSIKFSRIYLQEHPEIAGKINENTKLHVKYNNVDYPLFVSSYSRKSDDNILDEISVELSEKLTIAQNKSKEQMDSIMGNVNEQINSAIQNNNNNTSQGSIDGDLVAINNLINKKLSKITDDTAAGLITFLQGLVSQGAITAKDKITLGEYVESALWDGKGGCLDKDGNAWLRNLTLAESLTVPKLSYNFVEICPGIRWQSAGGGTIKEVEIESDADGNPTINGTITLDLKEGEIGQIAVGDLCMGVFHSMFDQAINATEDYDSGTGVMTRAGFYTCYFRITDILDTQYNSKARYVLRSDDKWPHSYHPSAQMVFAAYGNPLVKARQTSAYHANSYTRYLRDVTTWEFEAYNIAMQMGDLSNLGIFGYNPGGYSAFLNNVYVTGHIEEITDTRTYVHVAGLEDSHIEVGGSREVKMWLERDNHNYHDAEWTITRESGLPEADAEWNEAHKSVSSPLTLTSEDMGEGAYLQAVMFTFTGRKTITDDVTGNPISFEGSTSAMLTLISREDMWIDFTCEKGKTFSVLYNDVDIKVTAHLMYGNTDITNDILLRSSSTMKWKRDSEIPSADLVWTPTTDAKGNTLHIVDKPDVRHDCGDNWATSLRVTFIFECTVIFGAEIIPLSGEVTIG